MIVQCTGCLSSAEVWLPDSSPCLLPDLPDGQLFGMVRSVTDHWSDDDDEVDDGGGVQMILISNTFTLVR